MLLEMWKPSMSVSFLHHYSPEAVLSIGGYHLVPGSCMLFFHISLHGSPANESPRKLVTKSLNYTERFCWLAADSGIHWTTQACYFFKCCASVMLKGCVIRCFSFSFVIKFQSHLTHWCRYDFWASARKSVWGYFNGYEKTKCSSHSFHLSFMLKN